VWTIVKLLKLFNFRSFPHLHVTVHFWRSVRKHADQGILPIESLYLNKNALSSQIGSMPQPVKHFTLKRKPKSAVLRAELLQKCKFDFYFLSIIKAININFILIF